MFQKIPYVFFFLYMCLSGEESIIHLSEDANRLKFKSKKVYYLLKAQKHYLLI